METAIKTQTPLRGKLNQIRFILDNATKNLQNEVSKYEVFATKSSAASSSPASIANAGPNVQTYFKKLNDFKTMSSVLSCPLFKQIANVTDSLETLSHHVSLHPSIGPADIDIDVNGELILAPPIEATALNNLINGKQLNYYDLQEPSIRGLSNGSNQSYMGYSANQEVASDRAAHPAKNQVNTGPHVVSLKNGRSQKPTPHQQSTDKQNTWNSESSMNAYNTEKLITNGHNKVHVKNKATCDSSLEPANQGAGQRLYRSNGHFTLNQVATDVSDSSGPQSLGQGNEPERDIAGGSATNELYTKVVYDSNLMKTKAIERDQPLSNGAPNQNGDASELAPTYYNGGKFNRPPSTQGSNIQCNGGSCSSSVSAGSTVRLPNEYENGSYPYLPQLYKPSSTDSGAYSYQSQILKTASSCQQSTNSNQKPNEETSVNDTQVNESMNNCGPPESVENMDVEPSGYPERERIKVKLEKVGDSIGITIAGYFCKEENISGIFIRKVEPGSPAARSGKVKALDQIIAVNGCELLGYSNPDAVSVMRRAGSIVTLELERCLSESKYRKLQEAVAEAIPTIENNIGNSSDVTLSPSRSSIPISQRRENGDRTSKDCNSSNGKHVLVRVSKNSTNSSKAQPKEQLLKADISHNKQGNSTKNSSALRSISNQPSSPEHQSYIPKAAQRGTSSTKIIETKQGARNKIDIRSPVYQSTSPSEIIPATYVNRLVDQGPLSPTRTDTETNMSGDSTDQFNRYMLDATPEWNNDSEIIEIYKNSSQGLGFSVGEYNNPKDPSQTIIIVKSITPNGIAERDGRLAVGDLLIFVDDTNLEGASISETVRALKKTNGQVRLGVLKLKRNYLKN